MVLDGSTLQLLLTVGHRWRVVVLRKARLDYTTESQTFGKPVLTDIKQGIYSAPVLFAIAADTKVADLLVQEAYEQVFTIIHETHALDKTYALAKKHTDKALKLIQKLPDIPVKSDIHMITKTLLERQL